MTPPSPILVATCGNPFAAADAFGPLVAQALRDNPIPSVDVIDLGMRPAALLDHLHQRRALILVDAATGSGLPAGELFECDWDSPNRPQLVSQTPLSSHAIPLTDQLELARRLAILPPCVHLLVIEIGSTPLHLAAPPKSILRQILPARDRIVRFAQSFTPSASPP